MYKVYHQSTEAFSRGDNYFGEKDPDIEDLELVAEVDADDVEEAYNLTQNKSKPWVDNPRVKALKKDLRSTMVGDVLTKAPDSVFKYVRNYVVSPIGFRATRSIIDQF